MGKEAIKQQDINDAAWKACDTGEGLKEIQVGETVMKRIGKSKTNVVIYQAKNGQIEFRGDFKRDTIWGTQKQIADVFDIDRSVVTRHINKIMQDGEVEQKSNVQKMHIANSGSSATYFNPLTNKTCIRRSKKKPHTFSTSW